MTKTDRTQRAGCTSRRLTDRALSCRPPVTLPWVDRRPPARVAYRCGRPAAGAPPRAPGRRPVSSNALLGGSPPSLGAESRVANKDDPREEERRLEEIQDEARCVEGRRKRPLDANNHED